jgi:cysteine desulfurase
MENSLTYLDHAATTPARRAVLDAMLPYLGDAAFGNPHSSHRAGRAARAAIVAARRSLADSLGTDPGNVVFTSGGTESDNLAVLGTARAQAAAGVAVCLLISAIEHRAVLEPAQFLTREGARTIILPVDDKGRVALEAFDAALDADPVTLVSIMWVNNELGTIQPVEEIAARCQARDIPFHTDAVQAIGKVPVDLRNLPSAMVTVSGHKLGAPVGIGALIVPKRATVAPQLHGGGQQDAMRPGTENVAGAVGLATAVALAVAAQETEALRLGSLRHQLERGIVAAISDVVVHGFGANRAPHILSLGVRYSDAGALLAQLDMAGIAVSGGSACSSGAARRSHVIDAIDPVGDGATLRLSLGHTTTDQDIAHCIEVLPEAVSRTRHLQRRLASA